MVGLQRDDFGPPQMNGGAPPDGQETADAIADVLTEGPAEQGPLPQADLTGIVESPEPSVAGAETKITDYAEQELVAHTKRRFEQMVRFRHKRNLLRRFRFAMRAMNGEYDEGQLMEILSLGGATTHSQLISSKGQAATALLEDIYLSGERPWRLDPTPDPSLPSDAMAQIEQLVQLEVQAATAQQGGMPPDEMAVIERRQQLKDAVRRGVQRKAKKEAEIATKKCEDILVEGGFYEALGELLIDLPFFPFACIKGPIVEMRSRVRYDTSTSPGFGIDAGAASIEEVPTLTWKRVNPIDVYFAGNATHISGSDIIERVYYTRHDLADLLDIPGWREDRIRQVLNEFPYGLDDWRDTLDEERAAQEGRESPTGMDSEIICGVEYHGFVQGHKLLELGVKKRDITDPDRDYLTQMWIVGPYVLKAQVSPSLRKRHPYFVTSYKKMAGSVIGQALPDLLRDTEDVANAALRNLVNNMGLASGPQVVVQANRVDEGADIHSIYPWKMWFMVDEPNQGATPPVNFFQPQSNSQELIGIYKEMMTMADEVSLIPRYQHGGQAMGAGRTASGLEMLMSNAAKLQQMVAANIDNDIIEGTLTHLYDMLMVSSSELRGDEIITVSGVKKVAGKETERQRILELLQFTMNPIDQQIMGPKGRAVLLREVMRALNMPEGEIVPSHEDIAQNVREAAKLQMAQAAAEAQGEQGGGETSDDGPRTNTQQARSPDNMQQAQRGGAPQG